MKFFLSKSVHHFMSYYDRRQTRGRHPLSGIISRGKFADKLISRFSTNFVSSWPLDWL